MLRVFGEPRLHTQSHIWRKRLTNPLVERFHLGHWIAQQIHVVQVEETVVANLFAHLQRPHNVFAHLTFHVLAERRFVETVRAEHHGSRQLQEVAQRSARLKRIAMRPHKLCVGEHREQRGEVHRMRRHLQAPSSWRC